MKEICKFVIGSQVFFKGLQGYKPKDKDILYIMDEWTDPRSIVLNIKSPDGLDRLFLKNLPKNELITETLKFEKSTPMKAGKFLVPEFAKYIGLTIEDLKKLESMFLGMDEKHKYETVIYKCYLENNDFFLTDLQREEAFKVYNKSRE